MDLIPLIPKRITANSVLVLVSLIVLNAVALFACIFNGVWFLLLDKGIWLDVEYGKLLRNLTLTICVFCGCFVGFGVALGGQLFLFGDKKNFLFDLTKWACLIVIALTSVIQIALLITTIVFTRPHIAMEITDSLVFTLIHDPNSTNSKEWMKSHYDSRSVSLHSVAYKWVHTKCNAIYTADVISTVIIGVFLIMVFFSYLAYNYYDDPKVLVQTSTVVVGSPVEVTASEDESKASDTGKSDGQISITVEP